MLKAVIQQIVEECVTAKIKEMLSLDFPVAAVKTAAKEVVETVAARAVRANRKKQLCPVPGCRNAAAPIFGMVCGAHKDVPKSKIAVYRAVRKGDLDKAGAAEALRRIDKKNHKGAKPAKKKAAKPAKSGKTTPPQPENGFAVGAE